MMLIHALLLGVLGYAAARALLRRDATGIVVGVFLLGHAANLFIFASGGIEPGRAPLVSPGHDSPSPGHADPLPQALVLTAIVISFAVTAFLLALLARRASAGNGEEAGS